MKVLGSMAKRAGVVFGNTSNVTLWGAVLLFGYGAVANAQQIAADSAAAKPSFAVAETKPQETPSHHLFVTPPVTPHISEEESAKPAANDASHQGITVHGHWVIEVRNPDGSLAEHRDFQNSSQDKGFFIANVLAGRATAGEWVIRALGPLCADGATECRISQYANGVFNYIYAAGCATPSYHLGCGSGLTVSVGTGTGGAGPYTIVLSAQMTAAANGSITSVSTQMLNCVTTGSTYSLVSPASCGPKVDWPANTDVSITPVNSLPFFTGTTITPVVVSAGQSVLFTVTLSFS